MILVKEKNDLRDFAIDMESFLDLGTGLSRRLFRLRHYLMEGTL